MNLQHIYVGGTWIPSTSNELIDVLNPATAEVIGAVPAGTVDDVDKAVNSARIAFETWRSLPVTERAAKLRAIAAGIRDRSESIIEAAIADIGCTRRTATGMSVNVPASTFDHAADLIENYEFERLDGKLKLVKEPVGVVGAITPWNYPLHQIAAKVAPALAAGCTVVLKPSEVAPLTAWLFAEVVDGAGLPAGTFNMVSGYGVPVGEAIAAHPDVDMVSLTGSVQAGSRVASLAAASVKRVTLELGGKSANVVLEDVKDIAPIAAETFNALMSNAGQTCSALTRLIVPRGRLVEFEQHLSALAGQVNIGDPADESTALGPVVSQAQFDRVRGHIAKAVEEGARLVTGGLDRPRADGYFIAPTVFSDVSSDMEIAQEEVFGPVLAVLPYDSEEEAIAIANDSRYGLSGGVWSGDIGHAEDVAKQLRTGQVKVNGGAFNPRAPFGGYKHSGVGRELGEVGLDEFFETKALMF